MQLSNMDVYISTHAHNLRARSDRAHEHHWIGIDVIAMAHTHTHTHVYTFVFVCEARRRLDETQRAPPLTFPFEVAGTLES